MMLLFLEMVFLILDVKCIQTLKVELVSNTSRSKLKEIN